MPRRRTEEAEREERRDKVMGLLLAGGSTRSIAKIVGVHHATVARDIDARLKGAAEACRSTADLRLIEEKRLDALLLQWWGAAQRGLHALDRILRLLERRAKLLGLDMPQKLEHSGKEPRQDNRKRAWDIQHAIHEEMRERLRLREGRSVTELVKEANRGARRPQLRPSLRYEHY